METNSNVEHDALRGGRTFTDLIEFVFASNKDLELFSLVILELVESPKQSPIRQGCLPLNKILEHFRERQIKAFDSPATSSLYRSQQKASWSPLEAPRYKINYDAATFT